MKTYTHTHTHTHRNKKTKVRFVLCLKLYRVKQDRLTRKKEEDRDKEN